MTFQLRYSRLPRPTAAIWLGECTNYDDRHHIISPIVTPTCPASCLLGYYEAHVANRPAAPSTPIPADLLRFTRSPKWADSVVSRGDHDGPASGVQAVRSRQMISKFGNCGRSRGTHFPEADGIDSARDAGHSICGGLLLDVRSRAGKLVFWPGCRRKFSLRA